MGTMPAGPPPAPGRAGAQPLDRPPPSPEVPAGSPGSPQPLMSGPEGAEGQGGVGQLVKMVAGLDKFLLELARSLPAGAEDFNMARENIKRRDRPNPCDWARCGWVAIPWWRILRARLDNQPGGPGSAGPTREATKAVGGR